MRVSICIGSACHLNGSRQVVGRLQQLVAAHDLDDRVELEGSLCKGSCGRGVCVAVDGERFFVQPQNVEDFFMKTILARAKS